ncbi:hypothetical protein [Pedobacter miscanthi]|uniref:Uncharacterized protein n=1 Tax=Pedobacter miscanthi TaxID=2259170 RepID=A0A366L4X9_9SPHI|nr:hypothetical protein [Pedobacter miscanthi]RBQ08927.1 hypothetical protein DRW42_06880 [Pedobacter miscanthi]
MEIADDSNDGKTLSRIIQEYADLWADVMLDKNLMKALEKINKDINDLDRLIVRRGTQGLDTVIYSKIANQLLVMEEIIREKVNHPGL